MIIIAIDDLQISIPIHFIHAHFHFHIELCIFSMWSMSH